MGWDLNSTNLVFLIFRKAELPAQKLRRRGLSVEIFGGLLTVDPAGFFPDGAGNGFETGNMKALYGSMYGRYIQLHLVHFFW